MSENQKTEVFIDGITSMRLMAGVVRIDFGELSRPPMEGEAPEFSGKLRLFMPLDGFLRSLGSMQSMVEKLKSEGVLKAKDPAAPIDADSQGSA